MREIIPRPCCIMFEGALQEGESLSVSYFTFRNELSDRVECRAVQESVILSVAWLLKNAVGVLYVLNHFVNEKQSIYSPKVCCTALASEESNHFRIGDPHHVPSYRV